MARKIEKAESETYELKGRLAPVLPHEEFSANPYLLLILDRWKLIAAATFIAIVASYILTKTVMTPWYQATAIIEPIPEGAVENRVEGGMGGFGGGGMSSFLMSTGIDSQAQEYLTIFRSYTFNTEVAQRHNLTDYLLLGLKRPKTERKMRMKLFDILKGRFRVEYSIQGHNLSVHFLDIDPMKAQEILQFYLDDFRELQRQEAIRNATAAIESLQKEAGSTGDSLLRENLYALVARQVERQKLAEVEADFAFKILEAPISPDRPYTPHASLNCFLAMLFTPVLMALAIVLWQVWSVGRKSETPALRRRSTGEHSGASF